MKPNALLQTLREKQLLTVAIIATVVVGTVSAGVAIGVLTEQPDQERPQQTNKLVIINGTAHVTENSTVNYVNLTVRRGTRNVNLSSVTIEWLGPNVAENLVSKDKTTAGVETSSDSRYFRAVPLRDQDNSAPLVNAQTDRFKLVINVPAISGQRLAPGDTVELKLITPRRAVTRYTITIPESLGEQTTVQV